MRLLVSTAILTLAWFSALNVVCSLLVWLAVQCSGNRIRRGAQWLFAVRIAPSVVAAVFALGLFLPVHLMNEGREGSEYFGVLLWSLAVLGVALLAGSACRMVTAVRACRRLRKTWIGPSDERRPIVSDSEMVGISLAGIVRTTIVVGKRVREALTREELEVALAHEVAHRRSWDNAKRFAMFASPDVLRFTRAARDLEQSWGGEVECLADARAVEGDELRAANLASALLKVARLAAIGPGALPAGPLWSTFYEEALLETRVRRLVDGAVTAPRPSWMLAITSASTAAGTLGLVWIAGVPRAVHLVTEGLVRLLP
jgi:Zn-dependent protease with chaperone function